MTAPRELDCHEVARQLYEYLDHELTSADEAAVRAHLSDCEKCFSLFDFERAYLKFLTARSRAQGAPEHLRKRLFERLLFGPDGAEPA